MHCILYLVNSASNHVLGVVYYEAVQFTVGKPLHTRVIA